MTNPIPSMNYTIASYREGTVTLAEVARACVLNRMNWKDMWNLLNALQVSVDGYDWECDKQAICDRTKAAQAEGRAMIAADKAAEKAKAKPAAMIDRIMAKYGA
jgi:hypothetical protein